jgi:hypothetical protein
MTIEEAWLAWMRSSRSKSDPALFEDFDVIKKSSWWAAFEAGWKAGFNKGFGGSGEGWNAEWPGMDDARVKQWIARELGENSE